MAAQLAALFAFLQPSEEKPQKTDQAELALHADPTYWLYGLLSFCAKSCEAKTAEAGGEPDFRTSKERKQDSSAPALPTRDSLALMQTVVTSFASSWGSLKEGARVSNIPPSRKPQSWRWLTKKGCLTQALGRLFPLPPFIRRAFALRFRCGTNLRMGWLTQHSFFCTSGGAVGAGFAQVTLVDLRSSYQQGCEAKRNSKQQTQQTKTNKTKHKAARATFKVTRKAMKALGRVRQGR